MCDFNKEDAGKFTIDGESAASMDKVAFDGVAKLVVEKEVAGGDRQKIAAGSAYASSWIDVADYKRIEKIEGGLL